MAAIWALLVCRGPRRGEVCALKWTDVDLDAGQVRISRARVLVDGQATASSPKTDRGNRILPLDPLLVGLLRAHHRRQLKERMVAGPAYEDGGCLIADELGRPLYPDTVSERFDDPVRAAGVRRIRLHDCRHTAATLMLSEGRAVHVVAAILGHDPAVCLRTYGHVIPSDAADAGASLSRSLLG